MGFFGGATGGVDLGENNTASNQGVGGVGLFITKDGVDLQFRNINAASDKISVTLDGANKEVDIDVVEANLDHGNISGLGDDDHTQYHTNTRGDIRYYTKTLLDGGQLNGQYFQETEFLNSSAGVADAGKPIILNASGLVADNMISFPPETDPLALKKDGSTVMSGSFDLDGNKIISTAAFSLESNLNTNQIQLNTDGSLSLNGTLFQGANFANVQNLFLGASPTSSGTSNTGLGYQAGLSLSSGNNNTLVGSSAGDNITTGGGNTIVGSGPVGNSAIVFSIFIGLRSGLNSTGNNNIFIGSFIGENHQGNQNIAIGVSAASGGFTNDTVNNEMIVGARASPITVSYWGESGRSSTPGSFSFNGTQSAGTNLNAGANFDFNGARGSGTGTGSHIRLRTAPAGSSGSTVNALVTRLELTDDSKIAFHGVTPVARGSAIGDASGGATVDAEARTAVNALLAYLRSRGDINT